MTKKTTTKTRGKFRSMKNDCRCWIHFTGRCS